MVRPICIVSRMQCLLDRQRPANWFVQFPAEFSDKSQARSDSKSQSQATSRDGNASTPGRLCEASSNPLIPRVREELLRASLDPAIMKKPQHFSIVLFPPSLQPRWSPATHRQFSSSFRAAVRTLLLARSLGPPLRAADGSTVRQPRHAQCPLWKLPEKLVLFVFELLGDWD